MLESILPYFAALGISLMEITNGYTNTNTKKRYKYCVCEGILPYFASLGISLMEITNASGQSKWVSHDHNKYQLSSKSL